MKILLVAPQPFMEKRGTPLAVLQLLKALSELGHSVDLLTFHLGEDIALEGVRHYRTWSVPFIKRVGKGQSLTKVVLDILIFLMAARLLVKERYDCVHAVEEGAILSALLKPVSGARLIYDMDSSIPEQLKDANSPLWSNRFVVGAAACLESWAINRADLVIAVCKSLEERVMKVAAGKPVTLLEDIPNVGHFIPSMTAELTRLREELEVGAVRTVLYTGTFESYQGIDLLLRTVSLVVAEFPSVRFLLVGGEPDQVREKREEAEALGIADRVIILGKRPLEEMPIFMELADILVSPRNKGTNTPMKIYTYLQSGRPIVATRLLTHTQVLTDATAVLVKPNPPDLAAGILTLLRDDLLRTAIGEAGKRLVEERYSYSVFKSKVKEAYAFISHGK